MDASKSITNRPKTNYIMENYDNKTELSLSDDTFEKEIGKTLKKTCNHGNSFCQFDLEMTST